ncbi:MAG: hypothetical protein GC191_01920 [Azospirillum sp.]|nr:hypothetical protein [Azospirillum sp.]
MFTYGFSYLPVQALALATFYQCFARSMMLATPMPVPVRHARPIAVLPENVVHLATKLRATAAAPGPATPTVNATPAVIADATVIPFSAFRRNSLRCLPGGP